MKISDNKMLKKSFEKHLIKLILKYKNKGYNDYQIKLALIRKHYPSNIIDNLLNKAVLPEKSEHSFHFLFTIIIIILIMPLIAFLSYTLFTPKYEICTNIYCFSAVANKCGSALFTQEIEGISFLLKTSKCELIKQVKEVSQGELKEVQLLLKDKSMSCKFNKNELPEALINSVSKSLDNCEGSLKDALLSIK